MFLHTYQFLFNLLKADDMQIRPILNKLLIRLPMPLIIVLRLAQTHRPLIFYIDIYIMLFFTYFAAFSPNIFLLFLYMAIR